MRHPGPGRLQALRMRPADEIHRVDVEYDAVPMADKPLTLVIALATVEADLKLTSARND